MKRMWKRNAVVSCVLVLVCAAVYLNWKYAGNVAETEGKVLGESVLVSDEVSGDADEAAIYESESGDDYFAAARLTRQQARDSALALLQEAAAEENADQNPNFQQTQHNYLFQASYHHLHLLQLQVQDLKSFLQQYTAVRPQMNKR